jgi:hypothetical protein
MVRCENWEEDREVCGEDCGFGAPGYIDLESASNIAMLELRWIVVQFISQSGEHVVWLFCCTRCVLRFWMRREAEHGHGDIHTDEHQHHDQHGGQVDHPSERLN